MQTVAVLSQKGGVGKTTLSIHLAVAAYLAGKQSAIIDLDPQTSAMKWCDLREHAGISGPAVVDAKASRLEQVLSIAETNGASLSIIDTSPNSERDSLVAARCADLVLIPCKPSILDLDAIGSTVEIGRTLARKEVAVVLSMVSPRAGSGDEAAAAIQDGYNVMVAPVRIAHRMAFVHALAAGKSAQEYEPSGKAADEVKKLFKWLRAKIHV